MCLHVTSTRYVKGLIHFLENDLYLNLELPILQYPPPFYSNSGPYMGCIRHMENSSYNDKA